MTTLLARLCSAVLTVLLLISRPILLWMAARKRRSGAWRQRPPSSRQHQNTRPEPAIRAVQATADMTRAMAEEMRRVLNEDESHRRVYRHLAYFERKFAKYGLRTVEQLPVDQLRRALADFEALVRNWSSPSLADLRSRMAVVLADRSSAASIWIAANSVSHVGRPGPESMAGRLARNAGVALRNGQRGTRHLGMSRFQLGDGGFSSTSAPA